MDKALGRYLDDLPDLVIELSPRKIEHFAQQSHRKVGIGSAQDDISDLEHQYHL